MSTPREDIDNNLSYLEEAIKDVQGYDDEVLRKLSDLFYQLHQLIDAMWRASK